MVIYAIIKGANVANTFLLVSPAINAFAIRDVLDPNASPGSNDFVMPCSLCFAAKLRGADLGKGATHTLRLRLVC
jgi:hypothetical protein